MKTLHVSGVHEFDGEHDLGSESDVRITGDGPGLAGNVFDSMAVNT